MRTAVALLAKIMHPVATHTNKLRLDSQHVLAMRISGAGTRRLDGIRRALDTAGYCARATRLLL